MASLLIHLFHVENFRIPCFRLLLKLTLFRSTAANNALQSTRPLAARLSADMLLKPKYCSLPAGENSICGKLTAGFCVRNGIA